MPIIVADIVKVIFSSWMSGQLGLNIRHYRCTAITGTGPTEVEAANNLFTIFDGLYTDLMVSDADFLGVSVRVVNPGTTWAAGVSTAASVAGAVVGDPLPTQIAGIITMRTIQSGRANRGRVYVPFPCEVDSTADHVPSAGYVGRLGALAAALESTHTVGLAGNTAMLRPVILHEGGGTIDISGSTVREVWATQRRRGAYGRSNPRAIAV